MSEKKCDLVIVIVNRGYNELVMDAAKENGAKGGTVLHARGMGIHEAEKFFGISITPEKDVVLILVESRYKQEIMKAICKKAGLNTPGHGLSFSVPVEDVVGVTHLEELFKKPLSE